MNQALRLAPLLSSKRMDWGTPRALFDYLDAIFHFELDAATSPDNPLGTPRFYAPPQDAVLLPWARSTYLNPPYGRGLLGWVIKAAQEAERGNTVVALLPARPDTMWWEVCAEHEITYLKRRVTFEGAPSAAPFPSAIVVFRPRLPSRMAVPK